MRGGSFNNDISSALITMNRNIRGYFESEFNGITIDTAANCKSVMRKLQYEAYELEFGRTIPIRAAGKRGFNCIGGIGKVIGEAKIQILFHQLNLIIDVK